MPHRRGCHVNKIAHYAELCRSATVDEFVRAHADPVFVFDPAATRQSTAGGVDARTIDRLMLDNAPSPSTDLASLMHAHVVLPIRPRDPEEQQILVGCDKSCDVQIEDASISSIHACIERRGSTLLIRDADSTAGTQVNDRLLQPGQPKPLSPGDRVTLGFVSLTFLDAASLYSLVAS